MTVKELIRHLRVLPQDLDVCLLDAAQNAESDPLGEGSREGIFEIVSVEHQAGDDIPTDSPEWVAIHFTNPDYGE